MHRFTLILVFLLSGCASNQPEPLPVNKLFFLGNNIADVRSYRNAACCIGPTGTSTQVVLYDLLDPTKQFGGLGIDANGATINEEPDTGAGPVHAHRMVHEFEVEHLSLGVSFAETRHKNAIQKLLDGRYDRQLTQLRSFLSTIPATVYLRVGYDFDAYWHHGYANQLAYTNAYRYIADRVKTSNVQLVWQASASVVDDAYDGVAEDPTGWYPGESYVDWFAVSWRHHPDVVKTGLSQRSQATAIVEFARSQQKPVMIANASPVGYNFASGDTANHSVLLDGPAGENPQPLTSLAAWRNWYQPMFDFVMQHNDVVRAISYDNTNWRRYRDHKPPYPNGYYGDTRMEISTVIGSYFTRETGNWLAAP